MLLVDEIISALLCWHRSLVSANIFYRTLYTNKLRTVHVNKPICDVSAQCIVGHLSKVTGDKQDTLLDTHMPCIEIPWNSTRFNRRKTFNKKIIIFQKCLPPMDENTSDVSLKRYSIGMYEHWRTFWELEASKNGGHQRHAAHRPTHKYHYEGLWLCLSPKSRRQDNLAHA